MTRSRSMSLELGKEGSRKPMDIAASSNAFVVYGGIDGYNYLDFTGRLF